MNYRRVFIENGYVHLIIVAYNRQPIFIQNINLLKQAIINSKKYFNYELIAICVLPEHIHMILYPENIKDYPKIIISIKYYFSHIIKLLRILGLRTSHSMPYDTLLPLEWLRKVLICL